jgi:hypothetical protein
VWRPGPRRLAVTIEAPSLDMVRALDARTNISSAVEAVAQSGSEPEVHEDYVSAYDPGRFAESARFVRHYPEQTLEAGHFAWEQAPDEYARLILDWIGGGHRRVTAGA